MKQLCHKYYTFDKVNALFNRMNVTSWISNVFILGMLLIIIFLGCKKEEEAKDGWKNCLDCSAASWVGEFNGTGDYFDYETNSTKNDIPVSIKIEETAPEYLTIYFVAPNYLSTNISGSLVSNYIISFAGSGSSITATLNIKDQELKLDGNTRKFHYDSDSLVLDKLVSFEVTKIMN
jgi:hypothetical protein